MKTSRFTTVRFIVAAFLLAFAGGALGGFFGGIIVGYIMAVQDVNAKPPAVQEDTPLPGPPVQAIPAKTEKTFE